MAWVMKLLPVTLLTKKGVNAAIECLPRVRKLKLMEFNALARVYDVEKKLGDLETAYAELETELADREQEIRELEAEQVLLCEKWEAVYGCIGDLSIAAEEYHCTMDC